MRQLTLIEAGKLEWREVPDPTLAAPHGAIVRPIAAAVCDFDRALVRGEYPMLPFPIAIGHEMVAEVVETGPEARKLAVGSRVVLPLHINCGACDNCHDGRTNSCSSRPAFSSFGIGAAAGDWGGAMSDLVYVPWAEAMCAPLPEGVSPVQAASVGCNLVDIYRNIVPFMDKYRRPRVLVLGGRAHNMALYAIAVARALGLQDVDFIDDVPERQAQAEALGARPLGARRPRGELYHIVVDCSGMPERLAHGLGSIAPDGVCHPVLPYTEFVSIPLPAMFHRNATMITGQPHARANMDPVLKFIAEGKFDSTSIPVEVLPWEQAAGTYGFGEVKRIFVRS